MNIILASKSKPRQALMQKLGMPFTVIPSNYHEDMSAFDDPSKLAPFLALQKARDLAPSQPSSIIIGADTFGSLPNNTFLGKPKDLNQARQMLQAMSGNTVGVHTGLAIVLTDPQANIATERSHHQATFITFKNLSEKDITSIIENDDVLQVAGAIRIEGVCGQFIKHIDGDFDNIIGLPMKTLKTMLKGLPQ